jgi:DNA-binding CsgD family transcriptional regulator
MSALRQSDLLAVLDFVREAESYPDVPVFRSGILLRLRELVPCDVVGYNEIDAERGTVVVISEPRDALFDGVEETFARVAGQHPVLAHHAAGDLATYAISDFLSEREFHGLELYGDLFRQLGAEDQISFGLPGRIAIGIAMNRPRRSFSGRDHLVLDTLRPHLAQAWRHVLARGRSQELLAALEQGLETAGGAILVLDSAARLAHAGGPARDLLEAYFGRRDHIPPRLTDWIATEPGSRPLVVDGPRGRLIIRLLDAIAVDRQPVLLLEESRRFGPDAADLRALGLSRREAEILRLVAMGKENAEIAAELSVSVGTIRKHLERIYPKLGVHSRSAAAARALGVLAGFVFAAVQMIERVIDVEDLVLAVAGG